MIILRFPRRNNRLLQAAAIVGSAGNAATSERKIRDNCQHPAIPLAGAVATRAWGHLHYRRQGAESRCDKCRNTRSSVLLVRKEFLDLCQHAFLDHAPPILIAFEYCPP